MFYLAHILLQTDRDLIKAELLARSALDKDPTSVKYLALLGKILFQVEKYDLAQKAFYESM